jgi:LmbE family N-acetylglucosaminyl deacetylase
VTPAPGLKIFAACQELWGRLATCGRLLIGLPRMTAKVWLRLCCSVGQPILAAAGFPAGWPGLRVHREAGSKAGCRQNCLPQNRKGAVRILLTAALFLASAAAQQLHVIAFGAHPDDCDLGAAGTAAKFAQLGHAVKFVAVTNGDAGHQSIGGGDLAKRRRAEAMESARRLGITYEVLDNHDGELLPTVEVRKQIIKRIREWNADIVIAPRPNDYHPDHRYTGVLVQDAAYMVVVPNIVPDTPPLRKNPVFLYFQDGFQRPNPFRPDIAISIDDVADKKIDALDSHVSQFYEWLPWVDGTLDQVPKDPAARKAWLAGQRQKRQITPAIRASLIKWYGADKANQTKNAEAFEICEYGRQPNEAEIKQLFPMLPK